MDRIDKTCDRCHALLSIDTTFYIRIGDLPSKVICDNCHNEYTTVMENLFSSGKITGGGDREGIMKAKADWFNAPVTWQNERSDKDG